MKNFESQSASSQTATQPASQWACQPASQATSQAARGKRKRWCTSKRLPKPLEAYTATQLIRQRCLCTTTLDIQPSCQSLSHLLLQLACTARCTCFCRSFKFWSASHVSFRCHLSISSFGICSRSHFSCSRFLPWLAYHSLRLQDHSGRMQGWESVCSGETPYFRLCNVRWFPSIPLLSAN